MSMNNAYVTEEYLHRRIADVLRDAAKLQDDLNQSEAQSQALRQRIDAFETSQAEGGPSRNPPPDRSLIAKLEVEIAELRQQVGEGEQKLRDCTEEVQRVHHANGKLTQQITRQHDELSDGHKREIEAYHLKIQQQETEIEKLRQSSQDVNIRQSQNDELHAKILLLEDEIRGLRCAAEASDQFTRDRQAELEHNRLMLRRANEKISRLQSQNDSLQTAPNTANQRSLAAHVDTKETSQASGDNSTIAGSSFISSTLYMSRLPPQRKAALDVFPLITDVLEDTEALFSRKLLTGQLGGGVQSVIVNVDINKQRPLARHEISCYLCPNRDQNPWCPTRPGMHGYMFVGLGAEADTFVEPQTRHVFVSIGTKQYRYLGIYEASRVKDKLTVDEWEELPESFKNKYSKTTADKTINNVRTIAQTRAAYDSGVLHVPCVQLICVAFDKELYTALVEANGSNVFAVSSDSPHSGKRKRENDGSDYADHKSPQRKLMRDSPRC